MIRQITIIGTGLIGGSLGLAFRKAGFKGKIIGYDRPDVLRLAKRLRVISAAGADPVQASRGSDVVILATPVGTIIELIERLAAHLSPGVLLTDVGSTKSQIVSRAEKVFGSSALKRFLAGHPMAGKENAGVEYADADLFRGAVWFITPLPAQQIKNGIIKDYVSWLKKTGAKISVLDPEKHDRLCAWISHVPQFISTALASSLVEEYSENVPLLESGGRALREMTRTAASPYSMWRDIALTNKSGIADALLKLELRLAHIRENLDTRQLEEEFNRAHQLRNAKSLQKRGEKKK